MIDILMPRLSDTMEDGAITAWHKKPGDSVAPGDVLVEIETDKAIMEHEAYEAGTLAEILVSEGENAPIGTPIARLDDGTADPSATSGGRIAPVSVPTAPTKPVADDRAEPQRAAVVVEPDSLKPERRAATPLVRRLARERGVDLATVNGTGPGGESSAGICRRQRRPHGRTSMRVRPL